MKEDYNKETKKCDSTNLLLLISEGFLLENVYAHIIHRKLTCTPFLHKIQKPISHLLIITNNGQNLDSFINLHF